MGILADVSRRNDNLFYPRCILRESTFPRVDCTLQDYKICKSSCTSITDLLSVDQIATTFCSPASRWQTQKDWKHRINRKNCPLRIIFLSWVPIVQWKEVRNLHSWTVRHTDGSIRWRDWNCDFDKGKESNVGPFGTSYLIRYKATGLLKNCVERCQNSRFTANK